MQRALGSDPHLTLDKERKMLVDFVVHDVRKNSSAELLPGASNMP